MKLPEPIFTPTALEVRYHFKAPPERVFRAWTEPSQLAKWFHPAPDAPDALAEVDLRVGGRYRLGVPSADGEVFYVGGEYTEIDAPHKLAFTWRWEMAADEISDTLIVLEFREEEGGTELFLRHEGFNPMDHEERDQHAIGWNACAAHLYKLLDE